MTEEAYDAHMWDEVFGIINSQRNVQWKPNGRDNDIL